MKPFSVITINRNSGESILRTLESVLTQKRDLLQYIVVDGDSNDISKEIIEDHRTDIDVVISEPDNGIYDAMNKGIEKAVGGYVLFLNAGDYLHSTSILEQILINNSGEALIKVFGILKPFLQKGFKNPGRVAEGKRSQL